MQFFSFLNGIDVKNTGRKTKKILTTAIKKL